MVYLRNFLLNFNFMLLYSIQLFKNKKMNIIIDTK